jgi:hypothetical protein
MSMALLVDENRGADTASGRAKHNLGLAVPEHNRRAKRREAALARRNAPGPTGPGIEHTHAAVVHKPQSGCNRPGRHGERMCQRHAVAIAISNEARCRG